MTALITDQEVISWIAVADQLPDADTTVLVCSPRSHEPVWLGWYDGCFWFGVDATEYEEEAPVTAWAEIPKGPSR